MPSQSTTPARGWTLAGAFIAGGLLGGRLSTRLPARKGVLNLVVVAVYMLDQSASALDLF